MIKPLRRYVLRGGVKVSHEDIWKKRVQREGQCQGPQNEVFLVCSQNTPGSMGVVGAER